MSEIILISIPLSLGLWLVFLSARTNKRIDFVDRIAPQLRSIELKSSLSFEAQRTQLGVFDGLVELLKPVLVDFSTRFNFSSLDSEALKKRLVQEGRKRSITDFRAEQVVWAVAGLLLGGLVLGTGALNGKVPVAGAVILILFCALCGFLARDWWLTQKISEREKTMLAEFPALAELMALSVTAGESAVGALERVCNCSSGELTQEFRTVLAQTRSGDGLVVALLDFSQRTSVPHLSRFVDGIVVAIERGTPLSEVLRAQAQDVRDVAKRELMETAGKKEIAMMAPVIFFVLPLTVVFAVFPGISLLQLNF